MGGLNFGKELFPGIQEFAKLFNFADVLQNNSYVIYYAGTVQDSNGAEQRKLATFLFDSQQISSTAGQDTSSVLTKILDHDYDLRIDATARIRGIAIVEITGIANNTNGNHNENAFLIVRLRHWDGTTETEIGSGKGVIGDPNAETLTRRTPVFIDISTPIKFVKGDTLRLTVEAWMNTDNPGNTVGYSHDPTNRRARAYGSVTAETEDEPDRDLVLYLPFITAD